MTQQRKQTPMSNKNKGNYFDYSLLFIIIYMLCFGLVMLYSTSSYNAQLNFNDSTYYLKKQIVATAMGGVAMFFATKIDYKHWGRYAGILYLASLICIVMVLVPGIGLKINGARRWIKVGPLSFQPAEFAKLALIVFMAYVISKNTRSIHNFRKLLLIFCVAIPPIFLIAVVTKNLSSAIIILGIAVVMLFVASPRYLQFVIVGVVGVVGIWLFLNLESFRMQRLEVWRNPEKYSQEGGFQVLQALYAIGSGGVFGKGLGQSIQKLGFVPEAQNDMIFTIICEELGLFGAISVMLMFLFMIWRFMVIANNARDLFGSLIVVGIMAHIAIQVILNIAVVTNTFPNTGITLPFISYGGTSILFLMTEMGLALSVAKRIRCN